MTCDVLCQPCLGAGETEPSEHSADDGCTRSGRGRGTGCASPSGPGCTLRAAALPTSCNRAASFRVTSRGRTSPTTSSRWECRRSKNGTTRAEARPVLPRDQRSLPALPSDGLGPCYERFQGTDGLEGMAQDVQVVRQRLSHATQRLQLGQDNGQQAQAVELVEGGRRTGQGQQTCQFVADSLGRHMDQPTAVPADESLCLRSEGKAQSCCQPDRA